MHTNHALVNELTRAAFRPTPATRIEIDRVISLVRWRAQHDGHAVIRVIPTGPERTSWYQCRTHGCVSPIHRDGHRRCPLCGNTMLRQERVRADIANAERRARRRRYWQRRGQPWRERATAPRTYSDHSPSGSAARSAVTVSTCRALRQ